MNPNQIKNTSIMMDITSFIQTHIIEDVNSELNAETPLLEWGILDSLKMAELVTFIEQSYDILIDPEDISGSNFKNLMTIEAFVKNALMRKSNVAA